MLRLRPSRTHRFAGPAADRMRFKHQTFKHHGLHVCPPTLMFPLPLSDFEYYMLVDDRPSYPMVFVMAAQLSGAFQQTALQQALDELIQCHPLLRCCVVEIAGRGWCWRPLTTLGAAATGMGLLEWIDGDEASVAEFMPQVRSMDLTSEAGLQLVVRGFTDSGASNPVHSSCLL